MSKKIILKAKKDAPEFVSMGNLATEQADGHFQTDNRELADYLVAQNFAVETEDDHAPKRKKKSAARSKSRAIKETAATRTGAPDAPKQADEAKTSDAHSENSNEGEKQ